MPVTNSELGFKLIEERIENLQQMVTRGFRDLQKALDKHAEQYAEMETRVRAIEIEEAACRLARDDIGRVRDEVDKLKEQMVGSRVKIGLIVAGASTLASIIVVTLAKTILTGD